MELGARASAAYPVALSGPRRLRSGGFRKEEAGHDPGGEDILEKVPVEVEVAISREWQK